MYCSDGYDNPALPERAEVWLRTTHTRLDPLTALRLQRGAKHLHRLGLRFLCLCCPRAIRVCDQFSIVVTLPRNDSPTMGIAPALSQRCAAHPRPRMTAPLPRAAG